MEKDFFTDLNIAVITTRQVIETSSDVVYVGHDLEDGSWQFLSRDFNEGDARVVSLKNILELDPTLNELKNLELGNFAKRNNKLEMFKRQSFEKHL